MWIAKTQWNQGKGKGEYRNENIKIIYSIPPKFDLCMGERAASQSTMNESLQEIQRSYKKVASKAPYFYPFSSLSTHQGDRKRNQERKIIFL